MGALSRFRSYIAKFFSSKGWDKWGFIHNFPNEVYDLVPGLTIGPAVETFPGSSIYVPNASGEKPGEIFLTNNIAPTKVWMWQGTNWVELTG